MSAPGVRWVPGAAFAEASVVAVAVMVAGWVLAADQKLGEEFAVTASAEVDPVVGESTEAGEIGGYLAVESTAAAVAPPAVDVKSDFANAVCGIHSKSKED